MITNDIINIIFKYSSEIIRKNYPIYKNHLSKEVLDKLYTDWVKKIPIPKLLLPYELDIKNFLLHDNKLTIIIKDNKLGRKLHKWCDKLHINHYSTGKKSKRKFNMEKQTDWKWEFGKNPYKEKQKEKLKLEKENNLKRRKNIRCENCNKHNSKLYVNYTGIGPYCEECLDILEDDDGNPLWCHKFESIDDIGCF